MLLAYWEIVGPAADKNELSNKFVKDAKSAPPVLQRWVLNQVIMKQIKQSRTHIFKVVGDDNATVGVGKGNNQIN